MSQEVLLSKFLFAARRVHNLDRTTAIILVAPKTGDLYCANERMLTEKEIRLGDFVFGKTKNDGLLTSTMRKTEHTKKLKVRVEGDVAYVENINAQLIPAKEKFVFRSEDFSNALATGELQRGDYTVRINLMERPIEISPGVKICFEATNPLRTDNEDVVGFSEPSRSPIVGAGFPSNPVQLPTFKAVVLSVVEREGLRMHFLWIIDKQAEGRLIDENHPCQLGHFFEGTFKEKNGRWECAKYGKPLGKLVDGEVENNKTYFKVKLTEYRMARRNEKYAQGKAEYFDEILDIDSKVSLSCVEKFVKIQRRKIGDHEVAWVVVELI